MKNDTFLEREREIILKYGYYLIKKNDVGLWMDFERFLQYYRIASYEKPPVSNHSQQMIILLADFNQSAQFIDRMIQEDPAVLELCPHQRYKHDLGSIFVIQQCSWQSLENFLDFIAGVLSFHPHDYEHLTPVVDERFSCLSFRSNSI